MAIFCIIRIVTIFRLIDIDNLLCSWRAAVHQRRSPWPSCTVRMSDVPLVEELARKGPQCLKIPRKCDFCPRGQRLGHLPQSGGIDEQSCVAPGPKRIVGVSNSWGNAGTDGRCTGEMLIQCAFTTQVYTLQR